MKSKKVVEALDLSVERRPVESLIPYALNNKNHPDAQVSALAGFIREVGFRFPVAIDEDGSIIAGHGRVLAARKLGMVDVPCIVHSGLTERHKRALRIADNRIAELAETNSENLALELDELAREGFAVSLIGYSDEDIEALKRAASEITGDSELSTEPKLDGLIYQVIVSCDSETHQATLLESLEKDGLKCRPLIS